MAIVFDSAAGMFDKKTQSVRFKAAHGKTPLVCYITDQALEDHFGAPHEAEGTEGTEDTEEGARYVATFGQHRAMIEAKARELILALPMEEYYLGASAEISVWLGTMHF